MEYVYAAMLLHKAGKEVTEDGVKKVLEAADVKVDTSRIKALVAALKDVNIEEAIAKASVAAPVASAPAGTSSAPSDEKKEEKKEEEKADDGKAEEDAAAGLGALFG